MNDAAKILADAAQEFDPKANPRDATYRSLVWLAKKMRTKGEVLDVVTVGVYNGRVPAHILGNVEEARLCCVDTWGGGVAPRDARAVLARADWRAVKEIACKNLKPFKRRVTILEALSDEAAGNFADESADLVIVDGTRLSVPDDLGHWWRTVVQGGALAGTHYGSRRHGLVKVSVDALAFALNLEVQHLRGKVWVIKKPVTE